MIENAIITLIGLFILVAILTVAEFLAKKFDWE